MTRLVCFPTHQSPSKKTYVLKGTNLIYLLLKKNLFQNENKRYFDRVASPKSLTIPLKCLDAMNVRRL